MLGDAFVGFLLLNKTNLHLFTNANRMYCKQYLVPAYRLTFLRVYACACNATVPKNLSKSVAKNSLLYLCFCAPTFLIQAHGIPACVAIIVVAFHLLLVNLLGDFADLVGLLPQSAASLNAYAAYELMATMGTQLFVHIFTVSTGTALFVFSKYAKISWIEIG